jgi:hypothetical protein
MDKTTIDRMRYEQDLLTIAMQSEAFQMLIKKLDQAADEMPQEMMNLMLQGRTEEAEQIKYAYRALKVILPKKIETIVNAEKEESLFSFRDWLKDLFKRGT